MASFDETVVVTIMRKINALMGQNKYDLPGVSTRHAKRWFNWTRLPTGSAARQVAWKTWDQLQPADMADNKRAIFACVQQLVPTAPEKWTRSEFGAWFYEQAEAARDKVISTPRKPRSSAKTKRGQPGRIGHACGPAYNPNNPVHNRVNQLFKDAGFSVVEGVVSTGTESQVHLGPLYAYLANLQQSAEVPHQFAPGKTLRLDELYVELTATSDDLRTSFDNRFATEEASPGDGSEADPFQRWRSTVQQHRISLRTLVSRTGLAPAVLFGDPGAGKSTLTHYILHALGRSLVNRDGLSADGAMPFRISLPELVSHGKMDNYAILPFLVRRVLRVPPVHFENWLAFLKDFFNNQMPLRLLLLVDGVDEVTSSTQTFLTIKSQMEEVRSIARMIITSRRAGFQAPLENFARFDLIGLSEVTAHQLIQNWFRHVHPRCSGFAESLARWIRDDSRRQEMAQNPCLLSLLCYLNQDRPEDQFLHTVNRTELYRLAVTKLTADYARLGDSQVGMVLATLARFALDRYLNLRGGEVPHPFFSREEVLEFQHRIVSAPESVHGRDTDLNHAWTLTRLISSWDLGQWNHFIHLSFQEYFAAWRLMVLPETVVADLITCYRYDPYWREVWRFYAGLCRGEGASRKTRFLTLARACVEPRDLYDQCLLWLAPLCAEYGLRDTSAHLGFDLRAELYSYFLNLSSFYSMNNGLYSNAHSGLVPSPEQAFASIRSMVDLDPEYFLDLARQVLDRQVLRYQVPTSRRCKVKLPKPGTVRLAAVILENIRSGDAIRYQGALIHAEVHWPALRGEHPSLGPGSPSGRNEPLIEDLRQWLTTAVGPLQRERLVSYLSCAPGLRAAEAILEAARQEQRQLLQAKAKDEELLKFPLHCLGALCKLQDLRAVELADELWPKLRFLGREVVQACNFLAQIKDPKVAELMERWLDQNWLELDDGSAQVILWVLREWPERNLPRNVETVLADKNASPFLRADAWELLLRHGKIGELQRLRAYLHGLGTKRRLTMCEALELADIAIFIGTQKLPLLAEVEKLTKDVDKADGLLNDPLWVCLTQLHGRDSRLPSHRDWFSTVGLPAFIEALRQNNYSRIMEWVDALGNCSVEVVRELAGMMQEVWPALEIRSRGYLLSFFRTRPDFAPPAIVDEAARSPYCGLCVNAFNILAEVNPGLLVAPRKGDRGWDQLLFLKSLEDGTLFFPKEYYSPKKRAFVKYQRH